VSDLRRFPAHDPELQPEDSCVCIHGLLGVWDAELRSPEHIDHVKRPGRFDRLRERSKRRDAHHVALVRVDRDAVEALEREVAEDAEGRPTQVSGSTDDGDPSGGAQDPIDVGRVEDRDRTATLLQVEKRRGSCALLGRQWRASLSYGMPSAAGGMARPTTPASTMIVKM
jgi:hypothetical protein